MTISWIERCWQWKLVGCVALVGTLSAGVGEKVLAQIVLDNTLGAEASMVTPNVDIQGIVSDRIDGGATRGANLFHSFQEFNVGEGRGAYFANPTGIENILTRVTGGNPSNIWGRLGVLGGANLFLLNPNGIVFGANSSLDIQGSFVATTADAIQFSNGEVFSASTPEVPSSLLTVNPSAFLFNQVPAGAIINHSITPAEVNPTIGNVFGLQVPEGYSLLLLGGDILMDGGRLIALGGRVELGGVAGTGTVGLDMNGNELRLSFPDGVVLSDVSLTNGAEVNLPASGNGSIAINARNIDISGGSILRAGIASGLGAPQSQAGDIELNATEVVTLKDGGILANNTFGQGDAGGVKITASDTVFLDGNSSSIQSLVASGGVGNSGGITIDTGSLFVTNGAELNSSVTNQGEGNGGDIDIDAHNIVSFNGGFARSRLEKGGEGRAGNILITTGSLLLTGIPSKTADARIGQLVTATFGQGNAGSVIIHARDHVTLNGRGSDIYSLVGRDEGKGNGGDIIITSGSLSVTNGARLRADTEFQGMAGNIILNTDNLLIINDSNIVAKSGADSPYDGGEIIVNAGSLSLVNDVVLSAQSEGSGKAGDINITVRGTLEANNGRIRTDATQSSGGNITITADKIRLYGNSDIRTDVKSGADNAGNINLTAGSIIAFDDSDIIASASDGQGGNITFDTRVFFGENYSPASSRNDDPDTLDGNNRVDVNASGALNNGTITTPDLSYIQNSLNQLPDNQINTDRLLATSCIVRRNQPTTSTFFITGTGGLPQRPGDAQMSTFPTVDIETLPTDSTPANTTPNRPWQKGDPIIEPQGVYRLPNGKLIMSRECPE